MRRTDASPKARWLVERLAVVGYFVIVVMAFFGGWGKHVHNLLNARLNQGDDVLCRWRRRRRKG